MHYDAQIIFVDTPGIFKPKRRLDRAMVRRRGREPKMAMWLLHDCARYDVDDETLIILDNLARYSPEASLVLNKIDLVPTERLLNEPRNYQKNTT